MTFTLWPNNMNLFKTVSCCMIPTRILQQSAIAWIAMAVIYNHKLFMTLTLGVRVLYLFTVVIYVVTASAVSVCIAWKKVVVFTNQACLFCYNCKPTTVKFLQYRQQGVSKVYRLVQYPTVDDIMLW